MSNFAERIEDALDILKFDGAVPVSYTHLIHSYQSSVGERTTENEWTSQ